MEDLSELLAPVAAKKKLASIAAFDPARCSAAVIGDPKPHPAGFDQPGQQRAEIHDARVGRHRSCGPAAAPPGSEQRRCAAVRGEDTGIGIPADRLDRLFKSFSRWIAPPPANSAGPGLGLAISKRLVELMGGEIGFESEEGRGTTFSFTILGGICPATSARANAITDVTAAPAPAGPGALVGLHLLVAEDNEMNQFVTRRRYAAWDAPVRSLATARWPSRPSSDGPTTRC